MSSDKGEEALERLFNDVYDRQGNRLTWKQYVALVYDPAERMKYKRVAATMVGDHWVSTVWLGYDHNWGVGPPLIFETMVFHLLPDGTHESDDVWGRYPTEQAALDGHALCVRDLTEKLVHHA